MTRTLLALALGGASTACALAAVGGVLYAGHPQLAWALQCFAAWGFAAGLACGGLHLVAHGQPVQAPPALSAQDLHTLVRAAEAGAKAERQARAPRAGHAADRGPLPGPATQTAAAPALPAGQQAVAAAAPRAVRDEADAVAAP